MNEIKLSAPTAAKLKKLLIKQFCDSITMELEVAKCVVLYVLKGKNAFLLLLEVATRPFRRLNHTENSTACWCGGESLEKCLPFVKPSFVA